MKSIPCRSPLAFAQTKRHAAGGSASLVGEISIVLPDADERFA